MNIYIHLNHISGEIFYKYNMRTHLTEISSVNNF